MVSRRAGCLVAPADVTSGAARDSVHLITDAGSKHQCLGRAPWAGRGRCVRRDPRRRRRRQLSPHSSCATDQPPGGAVAVCDASARRVCVPGVDRDRVMAEGSRTTVGRHAVCRPARCRQRGTCPGCAATRSHLSKVRVSAGYPRTSLSIVLPAGFRGARRTSWSGVD